MWFNDSLRPLHMINYEQEGLELSMTNNGHTGRSTGGAGSLHECPHQMV